MENKLNCVIVDDESHAVKLIKDLISGNPNLALIKTYTNPLKALADISHSPVLDILFLDIDMPGLNGIQLAELIREKFRFLIFTTSHADYALKAYSVRASQFLVKPILEIDFLSAINRLDASPAKPKVSKEVMQLDDALYLQIISKGKVIRVAKEQICYIEPVKGRNYMRLITREESHVFSSSLTHLELNLCSDARFMRVNRSYIINLTKVLSFEGNRVNMENGEEVPIGPGYREQLMDYVSYKMMNKSAGRP